MCVPLDGTRFLFVVLAEVQRLRGRGGLLLSCTLGRTSMRVILFVAPMVPHLPAAALAVDVAADGGEISCGRLLSCLHAWPSPM